MGHMLHNFTDGLGHPVAKREAIPVHHDNRGEVSAVLHDTPVRVSYEMTSLGPEVDQVCINGAVIPGGYFDSDTRRGWERDIQRSRDDAGFVQ
jgi:hypothetical protein